MLSRVFAHPRQITAPPPVQPTPVAIQILVRSHREDRTQKLRALPDGRGEISGIASNASFEYFHDGAGERVYFSSEVLVRFDERSIQLFELPEGDAPVDTFRRIAAAMPNRYEARIVQQTRESLQFEIVRTAPPPLAISVVGLGRLRLAPVDPSCPDVARVPAFLDCRAVVERAVEQSGGTPLVAVRLLRRHFPALQVLNQASDGSVVISIG